MKSVILFSHGSLLCGAGEQLELHAQRLRASGEYPRVEIGYLNYSSPSFAQAVENCADAGATKILIAPYFLADGYFVQTGLPKVLDPQRARFPEIEFSVAPVLGDHPLLADGVLACAERANSTFDVQKSSSSIVHRSSLLLMVHGSPNEKSNDAMFRVLEMIRQRHEYSAVATGFLECNAPSISEAIENLISDGAKRIVAVPYFLHAGKHVAEDLPALLEAAQAKYSEVEFLLGDYLGREPLVARVLQARLHEAESQ